MLIHLPFLRRVTDLTEETPNKKAKTAAKSKTPAKPKAEPKVEPKAEDVSDLGGTMPGSPIVLPAVVVFLPPADHACVPLLVGSR